MLIAVGIGAFFSLFFHFGVDEVKQNQDYHSTVNQSTRPSAMKAFDWLKEKQFYQVMLSSLFTLQLHCFVICSVGISSSTIPKPHKCISKWDAIDIFEK